MRPVLSSEARRLLYSVTAMQHGRNPAEQMDIAQHLGIGDVIAEIRQPQPEPLSYLYIMDTVTPVGKFFKIGHSIHPAKRLKQIQSGKGAAMPPEWNGDTVCLQATKRGSPGDERAVHHELREHRVLGTEWFIASMVLAEQLINQGGWDIWKGQA